MSICPDSAGRSVGFGLCAALLVYLAAAPMPASACSCAWRGPFLTVAPGAPLVVRGRVLRHHPGPGPAMDVLVLETLTGGLLDSGLRLQMGDGMQCRPDMAGFPAGSEWVLALNGPGAKPGDGLALSHCGEYWVRVEGDEAVGRLEGGQGETTRMPLSELRLRLRYPRFAETFGGWIKAGGRFRRPVGPGFEFVLEPAAAGWEIVIREQGREENLARLTPPLHFAPNPREIEGWHLADAPATCPRPYGAEAGPEHPRHFIFSPEVGRRIAGPDARRAVTPEEVEAVRRFGRGTLTIERFALRPGSDGCPQPEWIEFSVHLEGGF
jgi:hypothetical protein